MKERTAGVFIGRFQPFHNGHVEIIRRMVQECDSVFIFVGSANKHSSIKNPLTFQERRKVIEDWINFELTQAFKIDEEIRPTIQVLPSNDYLYKEWKWKAGIVKQVQGDFKNVRLYGHEKDDSSYYLQEFPEWEFVPCANVNEINSTNIRKTFFESEVLSRYVMPSASINMMHKLKESNHFQDLVEEFEFYENEAIKFSKYPYPETIGFMCSDAVVNCMGNILLVKRKNAPGKGTWALPGGFKERNETFLEGCIRELREETNLRIPEKVLKGSIKESKVFDSPNRTLGIPRVSTAFYIEVSPNNDGSLPTYRPASDALEVRWVSLSEIDAMALFDDHKDIIESFV